MPKSYIFKKIDNKLLHSEIFHNSTDFLNSIIKDYDKNFTYIKNSYEINTLLNNYVRHKYLFAPILLITCKELNFQYIILLQEYKDTILDISLFDSFLNEQESVNDLILLYTRLARLKSFT